MPNSAPHNIPYDLTQPDALSLSWRRDFRWPIPLTRYYEINSQFSSQYAAFAIDCVEQDRAVVLLGRDTSLPALVDAAFVVSAEKADKPYLQGPPELDVLRGDLAVDDLRERGARYHVENSAVRFAAARRAVRTASWSRMLDLPRNSLIPHSVALSHNALLQSYARDRRASLGFKHGDPYLAGLRRQVGETASSIDCDALADRCVRTVLHFDCLDPVVESALQALAVPLVRAAFRRAASDLAMLARVKKLPRSVWTGNGGFYPGRAVGIEVLRRGGDVRRFDHGGTAALCAMSSFLAVQELAVSSAFVMPTAVAATTAAVVAARKSLAPGHDVTVEGHTGDPSLDIGTAGRRVGRQGLSRPRVLYIATAYYGFHQSIIPVPPGLVYADWQMHLIEALKSLPIELTCKPYPEGFVPRDAIPYGGMVRTRFDSFEAAVAEADVLVLDMAASTTFSIALSTDLPLVFIDLGLFQFNADVAASINARCRLVRTEIDANNRPRIDPDALAEAVCAGPEKDIDPGFFRGLFLGDTAA